MLRFYKDLRGILKVPQKDSILRELLMEHSHKNLVAFLKISNVVLFEKH